MLYPKPHVLRDDAEMVTLMGIAEHLPGDDEDDTSFLMWSALRRAREWSEGKVVRPPYDGVHVDAWRAGVAP